MITFTSLSVAAVAAVLWLIFDGDLLFSVITIALALTAFVLSLLKKIKLTKIFSIVVIIGSLSCLYFIPYTDGTHLIWQTVHKAEQAFNKDPENASGKLQTLLENTDEHFETVYARLAMSHLYQGHIEEACAATNEISDDNSDFYFLKQLIIIAANQADVDCTFHQRGANYIDELKETAYQAMERCPQWSYDYTLYGILQFDEYKNTDIARYCLLGGLNINEEDGNTWYYLGRVEYSDGNYQQALEYFQQAEKHPLNEDYKKGLNDYLQLTRKELNK